jgi:phospholipid/cholesterol/gamma-HCH transport system substrate-binding protein
MKISKYMKLGFLMVFSITALVWGLSYLKGHDFFKPVNYYYTRYQRVDGLQESSHVTVNGFRVGFVKNIRFAGDRSGDLIVTFMIDDQFKIPKNSVACIVSSDIMGTRSVKLTFTDSGEYFMAGDTIPGDIESDLKEQVSLQVLPLKNKAEELLSTIDSAITVLTVIFNEDARKNLSESFENINQTINNIEKSSADLKDLISNEKSSMSNLIRNMEDISGTLRNNSDRFSNVIRNLSSFTDTLATLPLTPVVHDMADAVGSMKNLLGRMDSDENSAGLLFRDDELYYNITGLTSGFQNLLTDIRNNPKRYLHFSAIDLGKDVYINTSSTGTQSAPKVVFRVHLVSSTSKIPLNSHLFEGLAAVDEIETSGAFSYLSGSYRNYSEAEKNLEAATRNFPDATIIAFRNGKIIKLERALRMKKK